MEQETSYKWSRLFHMPREHFDRMTKSLMRYVLVAITVPLTIYLTLFFIGLLLPKTIESRSHAFFAAPPPEIRESLQRLFPEKLVKGRVTPAGSELFVARGDAEIDRVKFSFSSVDDATLVVVEGRFDVPSPIDRTVLLLADSTDVYARAFLMMLSIELNPIFKRD